MSRLAGRGMNSPGSTSSGMVWEAAAVGIMALITRLLHLDHSPHIDEFFHILAARSWLEDGTLRIGDGVYSRSWVFTILVAGCFRLLGDSIVVARLPAAIAGSLLVTVLFLWVRREAGRTAGWVSAALLCFDPSAIYLSQLARFYAPQSLLFGIGAVGTYALVERRVTGGLALGLGALVAAAFSLALHLQVTTLIGLAAVGLWVVIRMGMRWLPVVRARSPRIREQTLLAAVAAGLVAAGLIAAQTSTVQALWAAYRSAPLWMKPWQDDVRWYHWWFADEYRALWCLLPLAVLIAVAARPTAAGFSAVVFGAAFVLHSFAAAKQTRFISYAMPFFAAIWGIALADAVPRLAAWIRGMVVVPTGRLAHGAGGSVATIGLVAGTLMFAAYGTPAFTTALRLIVPAHGQRPFRGPNWGAATPLLRQLADPAEIVVSSAGPKALYYLGRLDVALSASELADLSPTRSSPEFSLDYRTGRPVISRSESLQRLMECHRSGLVILERNHLNVEWHVPPAATEYLHRHTEDVSVPEWWRLRIFRWSRETTAPRDECASGLILGPGGNGHSRSDVRADNATTRSFPTYPALGDGRGRQGTHQ